MCLRWQYKRTIPPSYTLGDQQKLFETKKIVSRYHCEHKHDIYKIRGTYLRKQTGGKGFPMNSETQNGRDGAGTCILDAKVLHRYFLQQKQIFYSRNKHEILSRNLNKLNTMRFNNFHNLGLCQSLENSIQNDILISLGKEFPIITSKRYKEIKIMLYVHHFISLRKKCGRGFLY